MHNFLYRQHVLLPAPTETQVSFGLLTWCVRSPLMCDSSSQLHRSVLVNVPLLLGFLSPDLGTTFLSLRSRILSRGQSLLLAVLFLVFLNRLNIA